MNKERGPGDAISPMCQRGVALLMALGVTAVVMVAAAPVLTAAVTRAHVSDELAVRTHLHARATQGLQLCEQQVLKGPDPGGVQVLPPFKAAGGLDEAWWSQESTWRPGGHADNLVGRDPAVAGGGLAYSLHCVAECWMVDAPSTAPHGSDVQPGGESHQRVCDLDHQVLLLTVLAQHPCAQGMPSCVNFSADALPAVRVWRQAILKIQQGRVTDRMSRALIQAPWVSR